MFVVNFTESAREDLRFLKKAARNIVIDTVEEQLPSEPLQKTRNRKPLRPNELSSWELRIGNLRVFYDVDEGNNEVKVKAVGWKEHNRLYIRGKEYPL